MTTAGFEAEPVDVRALLHNLCGDDLAEPDWLVRYTRLTSQQALVEALVSAIKAQRGQALAQGRATGLSLEKIAEAVGMGTYQRVQQLIASAPRPDRCAHPGCDHAIRLARGGVGWCSDRHVPDDVPPAGGSDPADVLSLLNPPNRHPRKRS